MVGTGEIEIRCLPVPELPSLLLITSSMSTSSSDRLPFEIWEQILEESISFRDKMALETTCSPTTYLAFKATCNNSSTMYSHFDSEATRRVLRLVCRAWKMFADDWRHQDYWIGLSLELGADSPETSIRRVPIRLDIGLLYRRPISPPWMPKDESWLQAWCNNDILRNQKIRLTRFQMTNCQMDSQAYSRILQGLCNASSQLSGLRSLAIIILRQRKEDLNLISQCFPRLTHLTVQIAYSGLIASPLRIPDSDNDIIPIKKPLLAKLEVLFLYTRLGCLDITKWMVPQLHTLRITSVSRHWDTYIYPFLQNHGRQLETLDLDDRFTSWPGGWHVPGLSLEFWEILPRLRLLRIDLQSITMIGFPQREHPLEWLVHNYSLSSAKDLLSLLEGLEGKRSDGVERQLVLEGPYISRIDPADLDGRIGDILKDLKNNGLVLNGIKGSLVF